MPELNQRIQILINTIADGNVAEFVRMAKINSHQVLNRIFNIDKRTNKYPNVAASILTAIKINLPQINYDWILTGEGEMLKSGVSTAESDRIVGAKDAIIGISEAIAEIMAPHVREMAKVADACQKAANAADTLASTNSKLVDQLFEKLAHIEEKINSKGGAEAAPDAARMKGRG